ncbi:3-isopropylmalate dehydratase [Halostagnicola larsenii XH-48]|uniref:3-isopropylmalate dehydratase n=1 Tax=Halostagnicola larsenii XH-48 TaxID=797299 RepID=W0JQN7_9EURY|nr:PAC2 family protein [Halostagnicola larsenii]AHF99601.1 3-isopropylmalate dehydratase [Halostagnicola larsenii XH-48]
MSRIRIQGPEVDLENATLVEGFPGIGLVGKIATDHLIEELDMRYYASVHCEGLPRVGIYREGDRTVRPPVRLYVSEDKNVLALQSDTPISASAVDTVASCLTGWLVDEGVRPVYLSGRPAEQEGIPQITGVATGDAGDALDEIGVDPPSEDGVISGPTGALINRAAQQDYDALGLIVECNPNFPDPEAASELLEHAIAPLTDLSIDVDRLIERDEEIQEHREQFAKRMQEIGQEESSQARPLRMYQ